MKIANHSLAPISYQIVRGKHRGRVALLAPRQEVEFDGMSGDTFEICDEEGLPETAANTLPETRN